jgi:phosphate-selective porin OprO and OprP
MSRTFLTAGICLALVPTVTLAQERAKSSTPVTAITAADIQKAGSTDITRLYYNGDLRFETADKRNTTRIGGRVHFDGVYTDDDNQASDGVRFRRTRLYIRGTTNEVIDYKAQFDFAGGNVAWKDVYVKYNGLLGPLYLQAGQFYAPFGLETTQSSNDMTFVERAPGTVLSLDRASGFATGSSFAEGAGTWKFAIVNNETASDGDADSGHWEAVARGTYMMPIGDTDDSFLHFGGAISHGSSRDGLGFESRGGVSKGPQLVDVMAIPADGLQRVGLELGGVFGPFSAIAEYAMVDIDGSTGNADSSLDASYVQVSWFATGETRGYKGGNFTSIKPKTPWNGWGEGSGALEFALRYAMADFSDVAAGTTTAGVKGDVITLGANWYLNPNARIMFNYNMAESEDAGGATTDQDSAVVRFQWTF